MHPVRHLALRATSDVFNAQPGHFIPDGDGAHPHLAPDGHWTGSIGRRRRRFLHRRSYDSVTTLGKFLDPMADKLIVITALIMLVGMARTPHVPSWMVVILVSREIMVTGLRAVAAAEGLIVGAEELGKYKMALQSIAIHGLLLHYTYFHVDFFAAGMFILWISMLVSVWSCIDYYVRVIGALRPEPVSSSKRAAV